jgi:predicted TPR repeat methyltransferase
MVRRAVIIDALTAYAQVLTCRHPALVPMAAWRLGQFLDRLGDLDGAARAYAHIATDPDDTAQWAKTIKVIASTYRTSE